MKFLKSISLFCLILLMVLLGRYLFYSRNGNILPKENTKVVRENRVENGVTDLTVSTKQNVTTCDTVYEVHAYVGDSYEQRIEELPFSFSGLTREELLREVERYGISPSFEDKQKGFLSIELLEFHPERIRVKKMYAEEEEKIIYYLKAVDHELIVFRSDLEEAYMPTDLTLDMLPEDVQQDVIATKCFNDIRDVYSFLESYSS